MIDHPVPIVNNIPYADTARRVILWAGYKSAEPEHVNALAAFFVTRLTAENVLAIHGELSHPPINQDPGT